jgi:ribA/ribD-fused uncharacterized protein
MNNKITNYRNYIVQNVCAFRKTAEEFGGLSNMCGGFPLKINGIEILTSEALYQACRFPENPEIQEIILKEKSPITAKMKSKPHRHLTRKDWDSKRATIMYWCLQVKLAQNFIKFGSLLETTYGKDIVEESSKDAYWGAIKSKENETLLVGTNALGRLLMQLRKNYFENKYDLLLVNPPEVSNFYLLDKKIDIIDERENFIKTLQKHWEIEVTDNFKSNFDEMQFIEYYDKKLPKSNARKSKSKKADFGNTADLFS